MADTAATPAPSRGTAWRRRQQQLRAFERHERMSVLMCRAASVHHSRPSGFVGVARADIASCDLARTISVLQQHVRDLQRQVAALTSAQGRLDFDPANVPALVLRPHLRGVLELPLRALFSSGVMTLTARRPARKISSLVHCFATMAIQASMALSTTRATPRSSPWTRLCLRSRSMVLSAPLTKARWARIPEHHFQNFSRTSSCASSDVPAWL